MAGLPGGLSPMGVASLTRMVLRGSHRRRARHGARLGPHHSHTHVEGQVQVPHKVQLQRQADPEERGVERQQALALHAMLSFRCCPLRKAGLHLCVIPLEP